MIITAVSCYHSFYTQVQELSYTTVLMANTSRNLCSYSTTEFLMQV